MSCGVPHTECVDLFSLVIKEESTRHVSKRRHLNSDRTNFIHQISQIQNSAENCVENWDKPTTMAEWTLTKHDRLRAFKLENSSCVKVSSSRNADKKFY